MFLTGCNGETASTENRNGEKTEKQEAGNENGSSEEKIKGQFDNNGSKERQEENKQARPAMKNERPKYRINPANWSVHPIESADAQVVLLTFDDAPHEYSLTIANTLKQHGAKAIFFVNGHFIDTEPEKAVLKKIHEMGFAIGNHTYSHATLKGLSEDEQAAEIVKLNDAVEAITGERPKFFRAPFGMNTDFSKRLAAKENMLVMNWTYGYDWEKEYQNKAALVDIMVNSPYLNSGANLLMHDRKWTSDAISGIIKGLKRRGFETVDPALIETP
ncbi:polysaccharide deacetylase family protein [Peribacillus glennii]|uniref:Polysaccharide deacetylase family protein n=2 Tax=Peribacillus glennii TaxID=2303991 RepID=A0A372LCX8_9BACI|nr:polysaccharide deacetylase family protein [Peribacillus glennii]